MHLHKYDKWAVYNQEMKSVSKYGAYDYIAEWQQRECKKCGRIQRREL